MGLLAIGHTSIVNINDGQQGQQGPQGVSVQSEKEQWYLSNSSSSLSGGSWSYTEPTEIPTGKYLFGRIETTLSNGNKIYSTAVYRSVISGIMSKTDETAKKITDKIWESDINTKIDSYDSTTAQTIRDRVSATEQDLDGIHTTISSVQSTLDTKADGSTVTSLSNKVNTIDNTVSSHTQSISSLNTNIAKKADQSTVTTLTNRVSTIEQTAEGFKQTVEETYATKNEVDNIKIGTRNYIDNSEIFDKAKDPYKSSTVTVANYTNGNHKAYNTTSSNKFIVSFPELTVGKEYVFSYDWNRPWGAEQLVTKVDDKSETITTTNDTDWHRQVLKFTATANTTQAEIYINSTQPKTLYARHFQLEEGNLVSDWHPSEDDLKSYTDSQVATAKSEIKQTTDGISTLVSKKVGSDEIISKINQSAENITIDANKVNLVGAVTFSMLDNTTQDAITSMGSELIQSTHSSASATWTGASNILNSVEAGTRIAYKLNQDPPTGNVTLNLTLKDGTTTTGAKNVYYSGDTRLSKQYSKNSIIQLVFDGTAWRVVNPYTDENTDHYDRIRYQQPIQAWGTKISKGNIIVAQANNTGKYMPLNTKNAFDTSYPILYAENDIAANATNSTSNYLVYPLTITTTQSGTYTASKALYIKGTLSGTTFTPFTTPLTQTLPTTNDGYQYMLLGTMYSSTGLYLLAEHPIYQFYNGSFKTTSQIASEAAINAETANNTATQALNKTTDYITTNQIIIGTQTAKTGAWTGNSQLESLVDGQQITYWLPFPYDASGASAYTPNGSTSSQTGANLTLTLKDGTNTDAIPCFYSGINRLTSHYAAGNSIRFTYRENAVIGGVTVTKGWWADANYNTNDNTVDNLIKYFSGKTGAKGVWGYSLFMRDSSGTYQNICTASDGQVNTDASKVGLRTVETTKKANTTGFEVGSPIWMSTVTYAPNSNMSTASSVYSGFASLFDGRYAFNVQRAANSLIAYKPIYLVGTVNSQDGLYYLDTVWWTQTATDESKVYVLAGSCYDCTTSNVRIILYESNPWVVYRNGKLIDYNTNLAIDAQTAANLANETLANINVYNIQVKYGTSTSASTKPTSWSDTVPTWSEGTYIWQQTITNYKDGTSNTDEVCLTGHKGATGSAGKDAYTIVLSNESHTFPGGVSAATVSSSTTCTVTGYKGTASQTVSIGDIDAPSGMTITKSGATITFEVTGSLSTGGTINIPITMDGKAFTKTFSYSIAFKGTTGTAGNNSATVHLYQRATSKPAVPQGNLTYTFSSGKIIASTNLGSWTQAIPASDGNPCWVTVAVAVSNATTDTLAKTDWSDPVQLVNDGTNGTNGLNQATIFLYKRSASQPTISGTVTYTFNGGAMANIPSGWSKTIPATNGSPCWVTSAVAIGRDATASVSSWATPTKFVEDGADSTTYHIIASNSVITKTNSTYSPTSITFNAKSKTGTANMADYTGRLVVETTTDNSTWTSKNNTDTNTYTLSSIPANTIAIRASLYVKGDTAVLLDQQTVPVVSNGTNGTNGKDAYTVILTNESHTFAGGTTSAIAQDDVEIGIIGYKGATQMATTIETISGLPTPDGCMTATVAGSGTTSAKVTIKVTTAMATKSGTLTIPVTIDGKTFNKKFSYSLALKGDQGIQGNKGDDGISYSLIVSDSAIKLAADGTTYTPTSITLQAKSQTGKNAIANYSGRFKIETTSNGTSWTAPTNGTSTQNESSKTFTIPSGIVALRCSLYLAGGTTTLLDQQTIPVISDGVKGDTGVGVKSIVQYYALSASKPATTPPSNTTDWKTEPQAYSSGNLYWTCSVVTYTNNTTTTTTVVEHKGLNTAISTANTASTTATNANNTALSANEKASVGLAMKINYESFTTANAGECFLHGYTDGVPSDTDGYVYWNGRKITISKKMLNPNTICPYLKTIYIVLRLTSATATAGTLYMVWWDTAWKYASTPTPSSSAAWSWIEDRDIVLGQFIEPSSDGQIIDAYLYDPPRNASHVTSTGSNAYGYSKVAVDWVNEKGAGLLSAKEILDVWRTDAENNATTQINGGYIQTHTIEAEHLATDAIMSNNYDPGLEGSHFSAMGTFLDLSNGAIYSQNFGIDGTTGDTYVNGTIVANDGSIGIDSVNCWEIGTKMDYNGNDSAAIVGKGSAYIESGKIMLSGNKVNTQSYTENRQITYPIYDNKYYDMGMQAANPTSTSVDTHEKDFLYIRNTTLNKIPPEGGSKWEYPFRVTADGKIYATDIIINGGGTGSLYLPSTGGTISGSLEVTGTITGKLGKYIKINGQTFDGSNNVEVSTLGVKYGGTGATSFTSGYALIGAGENAITTRAIKNNTAKNNLGWTSGDTSLINSNTLAYWNGQYASGKSNLEYVALGKIGTIVTKDADDYLSTSGGIVDGTIQAVDINTGNLVVNGSARVVGDLYGNLTGNITGIATYSTKVKDSGNNTDTTFAYSKTALTNPTDFAAWNGYELRKISSSSMLSAIGAMSASKTFNRNDLVILATKTYTGILGTASNTAADDSFYFLKLRPDDFYCQWTFRYRIICTVPGHNEYRTTSDITFWGTGQANSPVYKIVNQIYNTGYRPIYYNNYYRLNSTGYNANYSNAIGIGLRQSNARNTSGYERTVVVEILENKYCTYQFLDTPVKWANWDGNGTTNYAGLSEYDGCTNGATQSGDRNNNNYERVLHPNTHLTAGENGMKQYSLVMQDKDGKWQSLTTTHGVAITKVKNPSAFKLGQIYYMSMSGNVAKNAVNGNSVVYSCLTGIDVRYTINCDDADNAIENNKPLWIVGTMNSGLFYLDDIWWTQTPPTTADGKIYIYIGYTYHASTTSKHSLDFMGWQGAYYNDGTNFVPYEEANVKKSGDTMSGDLTIANNDPSLTIRNDGGTGSAQILFERTGTNHADWKIINDGGYLKFQTDYNNKIVAYFDALRLDFNTGTAHFKNEVIATTFTGKLSGNATSANSATEATRLNQSTITSLDSFTHTTDLIYAYAGGSNTIAGKPTGADAFGVLSFKTAEGWFGQLLMSSNKETGVYWRTSTALSNTTWNKLLDSTNYTNYTVTKDGTGATGTWGINVTGNAGTATKLKTGVTITIGNKSNTLNGNEGTNGISFSKSEISGDASDSASGWMSADDKSKLDSITVSDIGTVGANSIKGDTNGGITVTIKNGVATLKHSNILTANGTAQTSTTSTLSNGGSFTVPKIDYDINGHITSTSTSTITLPNITTITGNAGTAGKFNSARKIELTGDVTGSASSDGESGWSIATTIADSSHNHDLGNILFGDSAKVGTLDPVTAAYIGHAASNKSFGLPRNAIVVEYSTDGGSTWTDYGATDEQVVGLFTETRGTSFVLGKSTNSGTNSTNNMLRVTIEPKDRYVSFNGVYIWMSTNGNTVKMDLQRSTIGAKDTFNTVFTNQSITGWSGPNIRYFPGGSFGGSSTQTSNFYKYRLIFKQTAINAERASASIIDIRFIGMSVWTSPTNSPMVAKNHMYTWDTDFNVTFPAEITATKFNGNIGWDNVTGKPITFIVNKGALNSGGWNKLGGKSNGEKIAISYNNNAAAWNCGSYSSSLLFGAVDTKGMLDICYNSPAVAFAGGSVGISTDDNPYWYFKITGTTATTYNLSDFLSKTGTAAKATADADGNTISSTYLKLSGGTMTGNLTVSSTSPTINIKNSGTGASALVLERAGSNAADWKIINSSGYLYFQNDYTTTQGDYFNVLTLAYNTGNATFKGEVTATKFNGNATSATTATTATNLSGFMNTKQGGQVAINNAITNGIYYVGGMNGLLGNKPDGAKITDGAAFVQAFNDTWVAQIYQDYRSGQIALRSKNDGTWQSWRKVVDSENVGTYAIPLTGGQITGNLKVSGVISANTANSSTAGGISLWGETPTSYGIAMRGIADSGKHGYVNKDWAIYSYMHGDATNISQRGWILRNKFNNINVASVSALGNAVFNGSITVGGNADNNSGVRMEYVESTKSLDFIFN